MRGAGLGGDGVVCAFGDRNYSCKSLGTGRKKRLLCHSLCPCGSGRGERQWSQTGSCCHLQKIPSGTRSDHTVTNQRIFNSKLRTLNAFPQHHWQKISSPKILIAWSHWQKNLSRQSSAGVSWIHYMMYLSYH